MVVTLYKQKTYEGCGISPVLLPNGLLVRQSTTGHPILMDPNNPSKRQLRFPRIGSRTLTPLFHSKISRVPIWIDDYPADRCSDTDHYLYDCSTNTLMKIEFTESIDVYASYTMFDQDAGVIKVCCNYNNVLKLYKLEGDVFKLASSENYNYHKIKDNPFTAFVKSGQDRDFSKPHSIKSSYQLGPKKWLLELNGEYGYVQLIIWDNDPHQDTNMLWEVIRNNLPPESKAKSVLGIPDMQRLISSFLVGEKGAYDESVGKREEKTKVRLERVRVDAIREARNARNREKAREKARRLREIKQLKDRIQVGIRAALTYQEHIDVWRLEIQDMQERIDGKEKDIQRIKEDVEQLKQQVNDAVDVFEVEYPKKRKRANKAAAEPPAKRRKQEQEQDEDSETETD